MRTRATFFPFFMKFGCFPKGGRGGPDSQDPPGGGGGGGSTSPLPNCGPFKDRANTPHSVFFEQRR